MPVKRRKSKRRADIDSDEWAYLLDEPEPADANPFTYLGLDHERSARASTLWHEYGEAATAEYVKMYPGQRPQLWWRYSAPEPRCKRDGICPASATWDRGNTGLPHGADENDYETEAEYLERLGLWLPGEREWLGEDR
jgi:hypothetical protein